MSRNIVLFDMDGTLTEARKPFASFLSSPLKQLAGLADIGIVTGSDFDYVQEQMGSVLADNSIRYSLHILPCNGTKYYKPPEFPSQGFELCNEVSMQKELGKHNWRRLMEIIISSQMRATEFDIPLTGHHIFNRGSMINWSPSGRNANDEERQRFIRFDKKFKFRKRVLSEIRNELDNVRMYDVTVKLGGDTSFDIYPQGWDKTYSLRYFQDSNVWFVGDRARTPRGNDYEIFKACEPRSFHTTGPEETVKIIENIIKQIGELK
jgi:phosphomannomutase